MTYQANDLFQLQSELVEAKVDIAVGKASDRIIDQITDRIENRIDRIENHIENLTSEVHKLNHRLGTVETKLGNRLAAVETKLGMRNEIRENIRNRLIDYAFKVGWLISTVVVSIVVSALFLYFHHI